MKQLKVIGALLIALTTSAYGHFVFLAPDATGTKVHVYFGETPAADPEVGLEKIAKIKLVAVLKDGSIKELKTEFADKKLSASLPANTVMVAGSLDYGVMKRGEGKAFLLRYEPRLIRAGFKSSDLAKVPGPVLAPKLVGSSRQVAISDGTKVVADAEFNLVSTTPAQKIKSDSKGIVTIASSEKNLAGWARVSFAASGKLGDQTYEEIRSYPTIVADWSDVQQSESIPKITSRFPPLPNAVSSFGAVVVGNHAYVYGGHMGKTHRYNETTASGDFHRLDLVKGTSWEKLAGGPRCQGMALVTDGQRIYRLGGMQPQNKVSAKTEHQSLASVACFDPKTGAWQDLPSMPAARSSFEAAIVGTKLYAFGGWHMGKEKSVWHDQMIVLDLNDTKAGWKNIEAPFIARAIGSAVYNGKIHVVGGLNEAGDSQLDHHVFDPAKGTWSEGVALPEPALNGFSPALAVVDGKLFLSPLDGVLYYLDGNKWTKQGTLQAKRMVHRILPGPKHEVIVLGGAAKQGNHDSVEAVNLRLASPVVSAQ